MNKKIGINIIGLMLVFSIFAESSFAGFSVYSARKETREMNKAGDVSTGTLSKPESDVSTLKKVGIVSGGVLGVGTLATLATSVGLATPTGACTIPSLALTAGTVGGVAALTAVSGGIALGAGLAAMGLSYGAYKLYKKYQSKLMGIESEKVAAIKLHAKKLSQNNRSNERELEKQLKNQYLEQRLNAICKNNGFADGVNLKLTQTKTATTNAFSMWRGQNYTALDETGTKQPYKYIKGSDHVIVTKLVCNENSPVTTDSTLNAILAAAAASNP